MKKNFENLLSFLPVFLIVGCATPLNYHPRLQGLDPSYNEAKASQDLERVLAQSFEVVTGRLSAPQIEIRSSEVKLDFASARAGWSKVSCGIDLGEKRDFIALDRGNDVRVPRANEKRFIVVSDQGQAPVCDVGFAKEDLAKDFANALYALQRRNVSTEAIAVATNPEPVNFPEIPGRISILRGQEKWEPSSRVFSLGTKIAVLEGDVSQATPWTIRILLQSQAESQSYRVDSFEKLTVLTGSVWVSFGKNQSRSQGRRYDAGSFLLTPAGVVHQIWTEKEGALIQVSGEGVWEPKKI
jgi:hypothetical protein